MYEMNVLNHYFHTLKHLIIKSFKNVIIDKSQISNYLMFCRRSQRRVDGFSSETAEPLV